MINITYTIFLRAMLDHMMFAHEMDDGSVNTDVNVANVSYRAEQKSKSNSGRRLEHKELRGIDETSISYDTTINMDVSDNGSGEDSTTTAKMEVMLESSDENIVMVKTFDCKSNFDDNDRERKIQTSITPSKNSEQSTADDNMISCEYDIDKGQENDEQVEDEEILIGAEEITESKAANIKIAKVSIVVPSGEAYVN